MFMYTDARPEWAKEADKILPEWPSVLPPPDWDHGNQTDFPGKKSEVYVDYRYPFTYIKRFDWGAKLPKFISPMEEPCEYLLTEVTGTHECLFHEDCLRVVRKLQEQHMSEGEDDIKYNFLVGGNGYVYEGRGFGLQIIHKNPERAEESWRKHDWNGKSLIFAYIAPYDSMPTGKSLITMKELIGMAIAKKHLKHTFLRIPGFFTKPDTT